MLLHGFTGGPGVFDGLGLSRTFAPFLPGHGPAPHLAAGGFDDAVDELAVAIPFDAPCTLVGYSMGARVALRLLARHPERFARAILIGVHPGLDDDEERGRRRAWEAGLSEVLATRGLAAFVDDWEALPVLRTVRPVPPARLVRRRAERLAHTARGLSHALAVLGLAAMPSTRPALAGIRVPVTLVAGGQDAKFLALARDLAAHMPAARVVEVPGTGHDVVLEAPEALVPLLGGHT